MTRFRLAIATSVIAVVVILWLCQVANRRSPPHWNEQLIIKLLGDEAWKTQLAKLGPRMQQVPGAVETNRQLFLARGLCRVMRDAACEQTSYAEFPFELKDIIRELLSSCPGFVENELRSATISVSIMPTGTLAMVIQAGTKHCAIETLDYGT